ncbi:FAD/NAD(P)-binding domain-containing protein [Gymnopus androsaceus JB14]|uniref:FAD/NAD(P)-binding domain-containing protein n=1 Tax=Gymnopus androsaceus JB14 TaxID=1447944 RepID=A0A6A4H523_9AGAR|nr:FAD/NAD(P)-binding domain-containing protein [Gymnopus androsaceus JB14]
MTHIGLTVPLNFVLAPLPLDNFQNGDKQYEQCKFRVAIVGCGIGGLTLAATISKFTSKAQGHNAIQIDLYESKNEVSVLGAGVGIWKRSWQVLQDLGFEEELVKRGVKVPVDGESRGPIFRKSDQPTQGYDFHDHVMPYGPLGLHRPTLLEILQSKLSPEHCSIHTSKALVNYTNTDSSIILHFSDSTTAEADVLIGADGVYSATRKVMFNSIAKEQGEDFAEYARPEYSGTLAYRGAVPTEALKEKYPEHRALDRPKAWCGKSQHVITHPLGPYIETSGAVDATREEIIALCEGWEPELLQVLECLGGPISCWVIHTVKPLPFCVSRNVGLIGDAAHGMLPHQGVGGGQAIEDAHLLGRLLAHSKATLRTIPAILKLHESLRLPAAQKAAKASYDNGLMYEFNYPGFVFNGPQGPTKEELKTLGDYIGESFAWLKEGDVEGDWMKAEEKLGKI